jgi:hypothetical protein
MELRELLDRQLEMAGAQIATLIDTEFTDVEIGRIARDIAAGLERSFKRCVPAWNADRNFGFNSAITSNQLSVLSQDLRDAMHVVRRTANIDKHEADPTHNADELIAAIATIRAGIPAITTALPVFADAVTVRRKRKVLVVFYDHLAGGETELHILPASSGYPRFSNVELDVFQVRAGDDDAVVAELGASGTWTWDPAEYKELLDQYRNEADAFWRGATFVGEFRDLVRIGARHQHTLEHLPGLNRSDQWTAARTASAMAAVDLWRADAPNPTAVEIEALTATEYGLTSGRGWTSRMAEAFAHLLAEARKGGVTQASGPNWLTRGQVAPQGSTVVATSDEADALTTDDGIVWLRSVPSSR